MGFLKVYTRKIVPEKYPASLANSIHFSYSLNGERFEPLNHNYGILFAKAEIREDETIAERGLQSPMICKKKGEYLIFAELVNEKGEPICEDKYLLWHTKDFVTFSEQEIVDKTAWQEAYDDSAGFVEITKKEWEKIRYRWVPIHSMTVSVPKEMKVKDPEEILNVKATVTYNDGSTDSKKVDWDIENRMPLTKTSFRVYGKVLERPLTFPRAVGFADPVIFSWEGSWYFLSTNDNLDDVGIYVRKADTVEGLFAEDVCTYCILDYNEAFGLIQTFWAPEFHIIGEDLYILFAVGGKEWAPRAHMMRLKPGGMVIYAEDWDRPVPVVRKDGSDLSGYGITLDMTYFKVGVTPYVAWSYRYGIGTTGDTGSMLYIATIDEKTPWRLTSDPILLSRPLYGWENNSGTINNEGPYALTIKDKLYLSYSGGAACGYSYAVGYLVADLTAEGKSQELLAPDGMPDLLKIENWRKEPSPVLHSLSIPGIRGPGHNSFFYDEDGVLRIAYHAQETEQYHKRCSTYHRVHVSKEGFPFLDMSPERDIGAKLQIVTMDIKVRK